MSGVPQFASNPVTAGVLISVANTNRDGTGTIGTLLTAGPNGTRIDEINVKARATTTAGMIRFFLHDGTTYYFWRELPVDAITPSGTIPSFESAIGNLGLILKPGWSLRCSTHNAEAFDVTACQAGDF